MVSLMRLAVINIQNVSRHYKYSVMHSDEFIQISFRM